MSGRKWRTLLKTENKDIFKVHPILSTSLNLDTPVLKESTIFYSLNYFRFKSRWCFFYYLVRNTDCIYVSKSKVRYSLISSLLHSFSRFDCFVLTPVHPGPSLPRTSVGTECGSGGKISSFTFNYSLSVTQHKNKTVYTLTRSIGL